MKFAKNRIKVTAIAMLLISIFAISLVASSNVTAQTTYYQQKTYAFIGATPNPVGVGQETLLDVGITQQVAEESGWKGLTVTVTKPDNTTETLGPVNTDPTGQTGIVFTPDQVGIYYLQTNFPQQNYNWTAQVVIAVSMSGVYTYLASTSEKYALNVTETPVPYYPSFPLPTEYWTRPINSQFYSWSDISGDWLTGRGGPTNRIAPYNDAPESGHVLWTKQVAEGGIVGGNFSDEPALSYETGDAYEGYGLPPIVMDGVLCYNCFGSDNLPQQGCVGVDLHTGKELWYRNNTVLSFGQEFYWDSFNMHGAFAYLWSTTGSTWNAYDPLTGDWVYAMTNVPSGTSIYGPNGEILRYTVDLTHGWMTLWNSTQVIHYAVQGVRDDGSWGNALIDENTNRTYDATKGIMWNVTIPKGLPGNVKETFLGDIMLGANVIDYAIWNTSAPIAIWAVNLKPGSEGQLLYNTTWMPPERDVMITYQGSSLEDNVFAIAIKETRVFYGFNLRTGQCIWGPTDPLPYQDNWILVAPINYYTSFAYGMMYHVAQSGTVEAFNDTTGKLMWTYDVKDPYNEALFGGNNWPMQIAFFSSGNIYIFRADHCPKDPRWRGGPFVCLNATTGEEIFEINSQGSYYGNHPVIADSIIAMLNCYDNSFYALGKGPSATTVSMGNNNGITLGNSILIDGFVTDVSPGTQQDAVKLRFPNGVPAVSDDSMSNWMEYVYMQFPKPTNATGVEVTLSVLDSNNNSRVIGTTTGDSDGFYSYVWTPDIPGKYTVTATFAGSESYWQSSAETAFFVVPAAPTASPYPVVNLPPTETYFTISTIAIIIAIAIIGALIMLMLRKRP
ncbi:MAG: hypothetical protein ABSB10_08445 [Candidatus Bathyarchaeia archaeon]